MSRKRGAAAGTRIFAAWSAPIMYAWRKVPRLYLCPKSLHGLWTGPRRENKFRASAKEWRPAFALFWRAFRARICAPHALVSKSTPLHYSIKSHPRLYRRLVLVGAVVLGALALIGCPENGGTTPREYTCTNGTPASGTTTEATTERCVSCNGGYRLDGVTCAANKYTCTNGTPQADGTAGANDGEQYCASCDSTYKLVSNTCATRTAYICPNGVVDSSVSGMMPAGNSDVVQCESCTSGYQLDTMMCVLNFALHANGVTVVCDRATVGDSGTVNGTTYTKRTKDQITNRDANAGSTCTSGITDMSALFSGDTSFNQDISHWDVSSVTNMANMFASVSDFNRDISKWDVSKVTNMDTMFGAAISFNQNISSWDVSSVTNMTRMFTGATAFNQDLSGWCVSKITSAPTNFAFRGNSGFTANRQPQWGSCP